MRILIILFINFFFFQWIYAQSTIDSLEQILPGSSGNQRIQIFIDLADATYPTNPAKALEYSTKAYQLATAENEQELMAESLKFTGFCHFYTYDFLTATKYLKQSLWIHTELGNKMEMAKISQNIGLAYLQANEYDSSGVYLNRATELHTLLGDQKEIAYCHTNLGLLSYLKSEYAAALDHYGRASEIYQQIDDPDNYANLLNRMAMTYHSLGINDKAVTYILESVREREKIGLPAKLATGYNNTGAIYKDMGDDKKALFYYNKAYRSYIEAKDSLGIPSVLTNIGSIYITKKQLDSALTYYKQALVYSEATGDEFQSSKTRHNMGLCYQRLGQLDTAASYLMQHINYCKEIGNIEGIAQASLSLGNVYLEQGMLRKADAFFSESILLAESKKLLSILKASYGARSELRETEGNYKEALSYCKMYKELNDSIYNIDKAKVISEMETKYETEKKEQEIIVLHKDNELQKRNVEYLILLSAGLILLGLISLVLFYQIRKNALSKKRLAELEAARLEEKVAHQKRELASGTLTLSRNLEFFNSLIEDIRTLTEFVDNDEAFASISRIVKKLEQQNSDKYWEEFEIRFQEIHRNFYHKLHEKFEGLTPNDLKLCALLKMGMNTKEICSVTFQNVRAVEAARLRLRKKLNLNSINNLAVFLQKL